MSTLTLYLLDARSERRMDGVVSLVAADDSGQFGILPGHEPMITALAPGLIRCRPAERGVFYAACAGGVLCCRDNEVRIVSARFLIGERADELTAELDRLLSAERAQQLAGRQSRTQVEQALLRRLREWSQAARA
ncbi:MAG TPA: F0F1 ATP synthase subunit epsilon [Burkholderiaceae bacterium]|nr:F0F1 ATP synthase subunit epsilon [Burkholderiaceae bacterium]